MKKTWNYIGKTIWLIMMITVSLIMLYPFIYSLLGALNRLEDFGHLGSLLPIPIKYVFMNFDYAFSPTALRPFLNTVTRTAWYTFLTITVALLVGFVMARYDFKGKRPLLVVMVASQVIPGVMTLIPSFLLMSKIPLVGGNNWMGIGGHGLINNPLVLYLPLGWGCLLWAFLFTQVMKSFPKAFEEAAEIDGSGFWGTMFRVIIPMQLPILAVIAVSTALGTWNDWLTPFMFIDKMKYTTLPAYVGMLATQLQEFSGTKDYPRIFGLANVAIIPPFLIFLFLQKYIIQGIASAGIKG